MIPAPTKIIKIKQIITERITLKNFYQRHISVFMGYSIKWACICISPTPLLLLSKSDLAFAYTDSK